MTNTAVVTGASSGVGQCIAVKLARAGWRVAIVARREDALRETITRAGDAGRNMLACPTDLGDAEQVRSMARRVLDAFGAVSVLVNSAGTNIRDRSLEKLSFEDYQRVMDVNLTGALLCIQAFLPGMREQKQGTIVNIVSDAGVRANAKAGAAYVCSKFGMAGLTQSINCEERQNGIRATAIYPGDINTPLLDRRPVPPPPEARLLMLQPEDVADCALLAINLPPRAIVEELMVRPR